MAQSFDKSYRDELICIGDPGYGVTVGGLEAAEAHNLEVIQDAIDHIGVEGKDGRDAATVAHLAVAAGFALVGCIESQEVHYPVNWREHIYHDQKTDQRKRFAKRGHMLLRAGACVDEAILCGLFGDYNSRAERRARCEGITGYSDANFGWGHAQSKKDAAPNRFRAVPYLEGTPPEKGGVVYVMHPEHMRSWYWIYPGAKKRAGDGLDRDYFEDGYHDVNTFRREESCVISHVRPQLANAARHPKHPFEGGIDLLSMYDFGILGMIDGFMPEEDGLRYPRRIPHEIAQWFTDRPQVTKARIPLVGNLDLPRDRIPTHYRFTQEMTQDPRTRPVPRRAPA